MSKGFGKSKQSNEILIDSMVASRTQEPAVVMKWGNQKAQFTPREAIAHAFSIIEVAVAAEFDALIVKWAQNQLSASPEMAVGLLRLFRLKRQSEQLPSMTMNFDGEPIRPDNARQMALEIITMAFGTEAEAFLLMFLMQELNQSGDVADTVIQEFREMRGVITLWSDEKGGDGEN